MKETQALLLITALNRAGLLHAVQGQAELWAAALNDVTYEDATEAVRAIITNRTHQERWTVPGDVIAGVRTIRDARINAIMGGTEPQPPEELIDDIASYNTWRRTFNRALGDGRTRQQAENIAHTATGLQPPHLETTRPHPTIAAQNRVA